MNGTFVYESGANKGFNMGGSKGKGGVPCLGIRGLQGFFLLNIQAFLCDSDF